MEPKDFVTAGLSIVAIVIAFTTLWIKVPENRRAIRSQLTDVIARLNTITVEARKLDIEQADRRYTTEVNAAFSLFNDQRTFLVRQAVFLAEQIPDHVTSPELAVIARAFTAIGDEKSADDYWARCIARSTSDHMRAINLRGFARYQFQKGEVGAGRESYRQSLGGLSGDMERYVNGETYLRWANDEYDAGFRDEGEKLFDRAAAEYALVKHPGRRRHGLLSLEHDRSKRNLTAPPAPPPAYTLTAPNDAPQAGGGGGGGGGGRAGLGWPHPAGLAEDKDLS